MRAAKSLYQSVRRSGAGATWSTPGRRAAARAAQAASSLPASRLCQRSVTSFAPPGLLRSRSRAARKHRVVESRPPDRSALTVPPSAVQASIAAISAARTAGTPSRAVRDGSGGLHHGRVRARPSASSSRQSKDGTACMPCHTQRSSSG
ncbi:hypothetical protein RB200_41235 [Streptomyces sp. PmtG]